MTAVDTNVLVDLIAGSAEHSQTAREALEHAATHGAVVVSAPVFAELLGFPGRANQVDSVLATAGITIQWDITPETWRRAGVAFGEFSARRLRASGGPPRRILADFLIGAHALTVGSLITRDPSFYRTNFPELRVIEPTSA